jgi:putative integral membrane protein (TIGR02587 family)
MAAPDEEHQPGLGAETEPVGPIGRLMVAASGALYFALNIAPTDEVRMLAAEASALQLAMAVVASLAVGLGIVFHAEFRGGRRPAMRDGPLTSPLGETAAAYVLSLLVSLLLLWAFGSTDGTGFNAVMAQVVMLGIVGSFGAAAARLLVGGGQASSSEGATT